MVKLMTSHLFSLIVNEIEFSTLGTLIQILVGDRFLLQDCGHATLKTTCKSFEKQKWEVVKENVPEMLDTFPAEISLEKNSMRRIFACILAFHLRSNYCHMNL